MCSGVQVSVEVTKAVNSPKALSDSKGYPIDLAVGDGKIVMANPGDKGQAELLADTNGEVKVRIDGQCFAQALKACGRNSLSCFFEGYSPSSVGVSPPPFCSNVPPKMLCTFLLETILTTEGDILATAEITADSSFNVRFCCVLVTLIMPSVLKTPTTIKLPTIPPIKP